MSAALRFGAVGVFVAAVDFGALWALSHFLPKLMAVSLAYFIGVATHFCLNKWWVFRSSRDVRLRELVNYAVMVCACWLCTVAAVWISLRLFTANVLLAKAMAVPPAALLAFVLMRWFVFRRD